MCIRDSLGTVIGMVMAFDKIQQAGDISPKMCIRDNDTTALGFAETMFDEFFQLVNFCVLTSAKLK